MKFCAGAHVKKIVSSRGGGGPRNVFLDLGRRTRNSHWSIIIRVIEFVAKDDLKGINRFSMGSNEDIR